jgi:serine/threonine protein kinase
MTVNETARYYQDFDVQTLYYRAPEVLLGIPFSYPIDIWYSSPFNQALVTSLSDHVE